ncbi:MAG: hypothetical protein V4735_03140 [Pseudomonadota bacterium]
MSIALVGAGLLAGVVLTMTSASTRSGCYETTQAQLTTIKDSLQKYAQQNDRYPLPANRRLGVSDPNFGREATVPTDIDTDATTGISYGALPFQALGLPTSFAADCWDNKFTYAVTTAYTTSAGFLDHAKTGAIAINSTAAAALLPEAAYAVISHGQDGIGAVKRNYAGASKEWCLTAATAALAPLQTKNCGLLPTLIASQFNDGKNSGDQYYDDLVAYNGRPQVLPCTLPARVDWTVSGNACAAKPDNTSHQMTNFDTIANVLNDVTLAAGYSGKVSVLCKNGVVDPVLDGSETCIPLPCTVSTTLTWLTGGNECSATATASSTAPVDNGATVALTTTGGTTSNSGTATATCDHGTFKLDPSVVQTCNLPACKPFFAPSMETKSEGSGFALVSTDGIRVWHGSGTNNYSMLPLKTTHISSGGIPTTNALVQLVFGPWAGGYNDTEGRLTPTSSGKWELTAPLPGNWRNDGGVGVYDTLYTLTVYDMETLTSAQMDSAHYDDHVSVEVNGVQVFNSEGGSMLEVPASLGGAYMKPSPGGLVQTCSDATYDQSPPVESGDSSPTYPAPTISCLTGGETGSARSSYNAVNIKPYLHAGANIIKVRTIIGGLGHGVVYMSASSRAPATPATSCATGNWALGPYSACSASCGGGTITASYYCTGGTGECTSPQPATLTQACNTQACGQCNTCSNGAVPLVRVGGNKENKTYTTYCADGSPYTSCAPPPVEYQNSSGDR